MIQADLARCDAEPIGIPGAIQPHGALLALHGPSLEIAQASASCADVLGVAPAALLGRPLAEALGAPLADAVREALARHLESPAAPDAFAAQSPSGALLAAHLHGAEALCLLELEPAHASALAPGDALARAVRAAALVRAQPALPAKLQAAADAVRKLTGYDRVMIYRFHADGHGEVIAESRRAGLEPYLGLHYPASDIPAQARRLYLCSPTRVIADVDYAPSPLVPPLDPQSGQPLDLSRSVLRSVSPIHLEYLRNMGVRATMTASLIRDGQLWGLISCHHQTPRPVSTGERAIADWMAQDLSTQIAMEEEAASRRRAAALKRAREEVLRALRGGARLAGLFDGPGRESLLASVGASGFALCSEDGIATCGAVPPPSRIEAIYQGLAALRGGGPAELFVTDCLSASLPETADLAATAAGCGMFPLRASAALHLLWFRGEQLREVRWGGNPDQALEVAPDGRLNPRKSFAAWSESVRLRSAPWLAEELDSARELGAMLDIELRRRAEESARVSTLLLGDVLDSLSSHIAVVDKRGVITAVNLPWKKFVEERGGGKECEVGASYLEACERALGAGAADAKAALEGIRGVLGGARTYFSREYPCDSPTEKRWFRVRVYPLSSGLPGAVIAHEQITASKLAELALREAEERFRSIVTSMAEGIVLQSATGEIVTCNPAAERILGLSREQMAGRTSIEPGWRALREDGSPFPADQRPALSTLRSGVAQRNVVMGVRNSAGESRWLSVSAEPLFLHPAERPYGVVTTFADITALREAHEQLRLALSASRSSVWELRLPADRIDYGDTFVTLLGYAPGEIAPTREVLRAQIHPDDLAQVLAVLGAMLRGETARYELEHRLRHKSGAWIWVLARGQVIERDPAGAALRAVGTLTDITARKQAEAALRESEQKLLEREERLRAIYLGSPLGIVRTDAERRILDANPAFVRLCGYPLEELVGMPIARLAHPETAAEEQRAARAVRARGAASVSLEARWKRRDGSTLWVSLNVQPSQESAGPRFYFGMVEDITARKEFERQLSLKTAELEELNRSLQVRVQGTAAELVDKDRLLLVQSRQAAMGEMIGNIAHQWRQPLNALALVQANLADAARFGELDGAAIGESVEESDRLIQQMSTTINDFLGFFHPEKVKRVFSALAQLRETIGLLEGSLRNAGVVVEVEVFSEPKLFGYANEYSQALLNLLTNARQAIQGAQVESGRIAIWVGERDGLGCVVLRDNGGGIPAQLLARLFEPYVSSKEGGTGVGLYMSRQIIERSMGGRLLARNIEGGAEFTVLVPLARTPGEAET